MGVAELPVSKGAYMRVKVREVSKGLHPSEVVVEVKTADGPEKLVIDKRAVEANSVSVGSPLGMRGDLYLVELPRETMSGAWRVWVPENQMRAEQKAKVA